MAQGTIKKVIADKGFGFIARDGDSDLFFHYTALEDCSIEELHEGQTVEYVEGEGKKGPCAVEIKAG
ncbi:MAG: cold shock domain-containing protein [Verrucomicrobiota bacterium]